MVDQNGDIQRFISHLYRKPNSTEKCQTNLYDLPDLTPRCPPFAPFKALPELAFVGGNGGMKGG